jgi:hypothetical protein
LRTYLLALTLLPALSAPTQQPAPVAAPAGANWQHVQALPVGTNINIKAKTSHASCKLKSADADTLTCSHGKDLVFQRTDIVNIKVQHRGRSTLVGLAVGVGVGAGVGYAAAGGPCNGICIIGPGTVAAAGAVGFGAIGSVVGYFTDFTKSTVYKAP